MDRIGEEGCERLTVLERRLLLRLDLDLFIIFTMIVAGVADSIIFARGPPVSAAVK